MGGGLAARGGDEGSRRGRGKLFAQIYISKDLAEIGIERVYLEKPARIS